MSARRDAGARRGAFLLAVVLVASQASAWFHAVAIAHVACVEHGEAVHRPAASAPDARPGRAVDAREISADLATVAGHDHCANAALLRWRDVALPGPVVLAAPGPGGPAAAPSRARDAAPRAAVYRLAPKTSPPSSV